MGESGRSRRNWTESELDIGEEGESPGELTGPSDIPTVTRAVARSEFRSSTRTPGPVRLPHPLPDAEFENPTHAPRGDATRDLESPSPASPC